MRILVLLLLLCKVVDIATGGEVGRLDNYQASGFLSVKNTFKHTFFLSSQQRFTQFRHWGDNRTRKYNPTAISFGYAYSKNNWHVGGALSFESGKDKMDFANSKNKVYGMTLFGGLNFESGWELKFTGFTARASSKEIVKDSAVFPLPPPPNVLSTSKENVYAFGASIDLGKSISVWNGVTIRPHIGIDYSATTSIKHKHYLSGYGLALLVNRRRDHFIEVPAGISVRKDFCFDDFVLSPVFDASLIHARKSRHGSPGFASFNGREWKTYAVDGGDIGGRFNFALKGRYRQNVDFGVDYTFEVRNDYTDHRLSASFGVKF